jgi:uncharacterized protein
VISLQHPFPEERAFTAVFLSWLTAQVAKMIRSWMKDGRLNLRWLYYTGGMPSAHSATVASLSTATGLYYGFNSILFLAVLIFSIITMFDAAGVRRNVGRQAKILNLMLDELQENGKIQEQRVKELLGHTPVEVFAGAFLGIVMTYLICGVR